MWVCVLLTGYHVPGCNVDDAGNDMFSINAIECHGTSVECMISCDNEFDGDGQDT